MAPHAHPGPAIGPARLALLTISDTRTAADDVSGETMRRLVESGGHTAVARVILPDELVPVRAWVAARLDDPGCDGVITSGGTGVSRRDRTYEALAALLELRLDGFGELFRALSFAEIGSAAMLSRAVGGVVRGKLLFCLPGSPPAVTLALERLILPELSHLIAEIRR